MGSILLLIIMGVTALSSLLFALKMTMEGLQSNSGKTEQSTRQKHIRLGNGAAFGNNR